MVDFSNAKIECVNLDVAMNTGDLGLYSTSFLFDSSKSHISSGSIHIRYVNTNEGSISYLYSGKFTARGTEIYLSTAGSPPTLLWKISNISFNSGDIYSFVINVYLPVPSSTSDSSSSNSSSTGTTAEGD